MTPILGSRPQCGERGPCRGPRCSVLRCASGWYAQWLALGSAPPRPRGCLVPKGPGVDRAAGLSLTLGFSLLSADWTAEERLPSPMRMRLPPARCPPGPRVLPPTPPPTDTPLHPLFSSSASSFSSSLSPVQCELGLGRVHWQTLLLDLLSFISHNQRRKGRLAKGRARDHRAHVLQKVLPTRTHTHTHTHTHALGGWHEPHLSSFPQPLRAERAYF